MENEMWIIEVKTGQKMPSHKTQLAMQRIIADECDRLETPGLEKIRKDETHLYRLDGNEIPGITTIVSAFNSFTPVDSIHSKRGTWFHRVFASYDDASERRRKDLDRWFSGYVSQLADEIRDKYKGYLRQYLTFRDTYLRDTIVYNEIPLASRKYRVAATLDKICFLENETKRTSLLYISPDKFELIDMKPNEIKIHLNEFLAAKIVWQKRGGSPIPYGHRQKNQIKALKEISKTKSVKKNLVSYIAAMEGKP